MDATENDAKILRPSEPAFDPLATVDAGPFLSLDDATPTTSSSTTGPLKRMEDFVAKTLAVKSGARRNIRSLKSKKELNPETLRAIEEENQRILQMETAETMPPSPDPDIEILTIEVPSEKQPQPSSSRSHFKVYPTQCQAGPSSAFDDDVDVIDISPVPSQSNGAGQSDVIFLDKTNQS